MDASLYLASAFAGAVLLILLRVLTPDEAYSGLRPDILMLIVGMVVVGMGLGCLNEGLVTADAVRAARVPLAGWIANHADPQMERGNERIDERPRGRGARTTRVEDRRSK